MFAYIGGGAGGGDGPRSPREHNPLNSTDVSGILECSYEPWMHDMRPAPVVVSTDGKGIYHYGVCGLHHDSVESVIRYLRGFHAPWTSIFEVPIIFDVTCDVSTSIHEAIRTFCMTDSYKAAYCVLASRDSAHANVIVKNEGQLYLLDPHRTTEPVCMPKIQQIFRKYMRDITFVARSREQAGEQSCAVVVLARIVYLVWKTRKSNERLIELMHRPVPCAFARWTAGIIKRVLPTGAIDSDVDRTTALSESDELHVATFWTKRSEEVKAGLVPLADSMESLVTHFPLSWISDHTHILRDITYAQSVARRFGVTLPLLYDLYANTVARTEHTDHVYYDDGMYGV